MWSHSLARFWTIFRMKIVKKFFHCLKISEPSLVCSPSPGWVLLVLSSHNVSNPMKSILLPLQVLSKNSVKWNVLKYYKQLHQFVKHLSIQKYWLDSYLLVFCQWHIFLNNSMSLVQKVWLCLPWNLYQAFQKRSQHSPVDMTLLQIKLILLRF